jgi:hypothetical protein
MAPLFGDLLHGQSQDWESLREHADAGCANCGGSGVECVSLDGRPQVNFSNGNAAIIFRALGIDMSAGYGDMELATLRRGLIRARNVAVPETLRASDESERVHVAGYSRGDLLRALARLDELVAAAQQLGATRLTWH